MIIRRLALFFAMLFGLAATQAPEFIQQYRQRLGGAIDELYAIVAQFDADSAKEGLSEGAGIARLQANPENLVKAQGTQMQATVSRLQTLTRSSESLAQAGTAGQIAHLVTNFDPRIASRAYESYQPAVPVTMDGFVTGLIGFVVGGALFRLFGWPVHRWSERRRLARQARSDLRTHGLVSRSR